MIINSISALSNFPNEIIKISLNPIDVAATRERLGVYFYNDIYNLGVDRFKTTGNYGLKSVNPPYSTFTTPSCYVTLPDNFPVTWSVSASNDYLYGSFSAGTSAFTIFPTHAYPAIETISTNIINVSSGLIAPYLKNDLMSKDEFRQNNLNPTLQPPSAYNCQIICTSAYFSVLKKDFVSYYIQNPTDSLQFQLDSNIIPESLSITFKTVTALALSPPNFLTYRQALQYNLLYRWSNFLDPHLGYSYSQFYQLYQNTANIIDYIPQLTYDYTVWGKDSDNTKLAGRELEKYYVTYPYVNSSSNINYATGLVYLDLDNNVFIPRNTPIHVTYQTRPPALNPSKFSITNLSPSVYQLSSAESIYFSTFDFTTSSTGLLPDVTYPGYSLSFYPKFDLINKALSSVQFSACMMDNYYQSKFAISEGRDKIRAKFTELSSDPTLSARNVATDELYKAGEWFPINSNIRFFNNNVANNHTVVFETSTFTGSYHYSNQYTFILNKNLASMNFAISALSDTKIFLNVTMFPNYDPNAQIKWSAFPPENITFSSFKDYVNYTPDATLYVPRWKTSYGIYYVGTQASYEGRVYESINAHYSYGYEPGVAAGWRNVWKLPVIPYTDVMSPSWNVLPDRMIDAGTALSNRGVNYVCINNHYSYGYEPGVGAGWQGAWKVVSIETPPFQFIGIEPNTLVGAGALDAYVGNLGVDKTTITLYSEEYDLSGSVTWYPTASSIWKNVNLIIKNDIDDNAYINTTPMTAFCVYNNLNYRVPLDANISWKETLNNSFGEFRLKDYNRNDMIENVIYPATFDYSVISPTFKTVKTYNDPSLVPFNVNCNISHRLYNLVTDKLLSYRRFPASNFSIILSADNGVYVDSKDFRNTFFTSSANAILSVNINAISAVPSTVNWTVNNISYSGLSVSVPVISSVCASVTAYDAKPYIGNFNTYNFMEDTCVFLLTGIQPFDYISFPRYVGSPQIELNVNNYYLSANGLTSYNVPCINNSIVISATQGFENYVYELANGPSLSSTSPIFYYPIDNATISSTSALPLKIRAYNHYFSPGDGDTIYNSISSDDSSLYKQHLRFVDIPTFNATLSSNGNHFHVAKPLDFVNFILQIEPLQIRNVTYDLVVDDGLTTYPIHLAGNDNKIDYVDRFTTDPTRVLSIKENTDTSFNVYASGIAYVTIGDSNMCPIPKTFITNQINVSAFDYPALDIYVNKSLLSSGELVSISTAFPQSCFYYNYQLDDGLGNIHSFTHNRVITAIYPSAGNYSPSVTSFNSLYPPSRRVYTDLLMVRDIFEDYNDKLFRYIPDNISLPYNNIHIDADEWQFADVYNEQVSKIFTNLETIKDNYTIVNPDFPKKYIGWFGERRNVVKWRFDESYKTEYHNYTFKNLKDLCFYNDHYILLADGKISFRSDDINLTEIFDIYRVPNAEIFTNPNKILVHGDVLYLLDTILKKVFVFNIDFDNHAVKFSHYWGGVGKNDSRTRLNNPTDFKLDVDGNLYIVDKDSGNIKIYNKYLNWTSSIILADYGIHALPVAMDRLGDNIYILTDNKQIIVLNNKLEVINILENIDGDALVVPDNESYRILTYTNNTLYIYYLNGTSLGSQTFEAVKQINAIKIKNKEIYIICDGIILKMIDYLQTFSVFNNNYSVSSWDMSACEIIPNEFVSDIVFNNSFLKMSNNICNLKNDIVDKFVYRVDALGNFITQTLSPINNSEIPTLTSLQLLGANEVVSYETINRNFNIISDNINAVREMIDVRVECVTSSEIIWVWDYHRIYSPQFTSKSKNPFTWAELTKNQSIINPLISGITWDNISFVNPGVDNQFPICWVWEQMSIQCIHPLRWDQIMPGTRYERTWEDLEDNCCQQPREIFDNCIDLC